MQNSKFGIFSFILSIVSLVIMILGFSWLTYAMYSYGSAEEFIIAMEDHNAFAAFASLTFTLFTFAYIFVAIIGLIFGIIAIRKKEFKKALAISGTSISSVIIVFTSLMIISGIN
ncbi:hypothetical protein ACFL21_04565 [Patescibacteria group bacterium]